MLTVTTKYYLQPKKLQVANEQQNGSVKHSRAQKLILEQRVRKVRDNRVRKEI